MSAPPVTAGLRVDLSADTLAPAGQGAAVTVWPDGSGNGNHAHLLGGGAPSVRIADTPGLGACVHFADGYLTFADAALFDAFTAAEVFAVVRSGTDFPGFYQFGGGDSTYYPWVDGNVYDGSFTATRFSFPAVSAGQWHTYNVAHDGVTRETRIDATSVHSATVAFAAPSATVKPTLKIGPVLSGYPWPGDIARVLVYNRALSAPERAQVHQYLVQAHFTVPSLTGSLAVGLELYGSLSGVAFALPVGPATLELAVQLSAQLTGLGESSLVVGPADAIGDAPAPESVDAQVTPISPADHAVTPATLPTFIVAVTTADDDAQLEVRYDSDPAFTAATSITAVIGAGLEQAPCPVTALVALTDGTVYYWQARVTGPIGAGPFSAVLSFAVNTPDGLAVAGGAYSVNPGLAAQPQLWLLDPDSDSEAGGTAAAAGTGFGSAPDVLLGELPCPVLGVDEVPETCLADGSDAVIDADTGEITVYHQRVSFTIADWDPDGAGDAVTVERTT